MLQIVLLLVLSYLLGSINPTYILGRLRGYDIRKKGKVGWGSAGATKAWHVLGKPYGVFVFVFDFFKAFFAAYIAALYVSSPTVLFFCIFFAAMGHNFPFYLRFKGGYGLACAWGGFSFFLYYFWGSWYQAWGYAILVLVAVFGVEMFYLFPTRRKVQRGKLVLGRKVLRFVALLIPLWYYFGVRARVLFALTFLALLAFLADVHNLRPGFLYKSSESQLSGVTFFLFSCLAVVVFLPKMLAILVLVYFIVVDNVAVICGKLCRVKDLLWNKEKSREGFRCALGAALLCGLFLYPYLGFSLTFLLVGALLAAVFESLPLGVDDNISLPVLLSFCLLFLSAVF